MGIVEKACQKTVIREISGISDCFVSKDEGKDKKPKVCISTQVLLDIDTNYIQARDKWL